MKNLLTKVAVATAAGAVLSLTCGGIPQANALDFSFSFSNEVGSENGTVSGILFGLDPTPNVNTSATSLQILNAPGALSVLNNTTLTSFAVNDFRHDGSQLTFTDLVATFIADSTQYGLRFRTGDNNFSDEFLCRTDSGFPFQGSACLTPSVIDTRIDSQQSFTSSVISSPTSVPEPASVVGFLALAALGATSKLKGKKKQKAE
ncbi:MULTISPECIES: PEP-CTERM sorting domain-containing protein [unclassified Coleofasciculus]|uniref:PEP-CTERM sorting domain-containing protein n=1 Tax=unclassified Coleofasciculus TaxID=2692782 RepID=UPI00188089D0|nr:MULTISPECIES: PEP-CTERM sorting domain-containing protein [unclassified Coleofasciculus]MBE9128115.1 PEP-CTERM sorting domain-containing protein [Coleofasciculus sp. LEGE 07081]MBE9151187.1 PEP-CTERM sorting domain-containing protein [Coleofasciculus sp. LEGE 07092]